MNPGNEDSFNFLTDLLEKRTGQLLSPNRYWRIETVLKPVMRKHGIPDLGSLQAVLSAGDSTALADETVEAMLNNETSFFRDQASFSLLTGPVLNHLRTHREKSRKLRIWSAACSSGQEAYSLAMSLREDREKWLGWTIEIVGSDVSRGVVEKARTGRYSQFEIQRGLPVSQMLRYFRQEGEEWVAAEELRRMVDFRVQNLLEPLAMPGKFDIVLCRNMLMYLDEHQRTKTFDSLARSIAPDGFLMLGAVETVIGQTESFRASREFRGFYEPADSASLRSAA